MVQAKSQWKLPLELARRASARWVVAPGSIEPVTRSGNYVLRFRDAASGRTRYMRISPPDYRPRDQIEAEVDFVRHLDSKGVPVAAPVQSRRGKWVETLRTRRAGKQHEQYVAVFEAVGGQIARWTRDQEANCRMIFERGQALGRLHHAARGYRPRGNFKRFHWFEDDLFSDPGYYFPRRDVIQRREYESLINWMLDRDATEENYGMVHGDFGSGNMFRREDGSMVAFDFDDCLHHWFIYDLAVSIRSAAAMEYEQRRKYLSAMLDGYREEKDTGGDGAEEVGRFCHLGALYRYVTVLRECNRRRGRMTGEQRDRFNRRLELLRNPLRWH